MRSKSSKLLSIAPTSFTNTRFFCALAKVDMYVKKLLPIKKTAMETIQGLKLFTEIWYLYDLTKLSEEVKIIKFSHTH